MKATVVVLPTLRGVNLQAAVVHEGSHLEDFQRFLASFDKQGNANAALNISTKESEQRAYGLNGDLARLTGETIRYNGGTFKPIMTSEQVNREIQRILAGIEREKPGYLQERLYNWP